MINYSIIIKVVGLLLLFTALLMLACVPISFYYDDETWSAFLSSALVAILFGGSFVMGTPHSDFQKLRNREGYVIVTASWLVVSLFVALPYLFSQSIPSLADACFESVSGLTTTGSSILNDIESLPPTILFWRSLSHWLGGMGIIVLTIAILPLFGIGGMQLFVAEAPGISPDKLHPRITETAKRLWFIYLMLTVVLCTCLYAAGMSVFDAVNHAMSTVSTGGFSTKQASIAHYQSPLIDYIICAFMFISGCNFTMIYFGFKGRFKAIWTNESFRIYCLFIVLLTPVLALLVYQVGGHSAEQAFRDTLFQILAVVTTTGFATADFTSWSPLLTLIFFLLMFSGASAGSTSGGIKLVRHIIMVKNSFLEFKRAIHPSAVIPVRLDKKAITPKITNNILAFFLIYIAVFAVGTLVMSGTGMDFQTAMGATAASLGNVGPGLGDVGPSFSYAAVSDFGKCFLSFLMILGRLELFTVLILFMPYFWRR